MRFCQVKFSLETNLEALQWHTFIIKTIIPGTITKILPNKTPKAEIVGGLGVIRIVSV